MKRHDTNPASLAITISSHVGFSTLSPYIRQQPLAMQQRFNLLFPDFVDHIQLPLPLASTLFRENYILCEKKIEMSLIKSPANGVVIKEISDGLK